MTVTVDQADLQGNILCGYGFGYAALVAITVTDARGGRALLRDLLGDVTNAAPWPQRPASTLNVALSHAGLAALGVAPDVLDSFAPELREGMASRAALLGDVSAGAPAQWEDCLNEQRAHVLIRIDAESADAAVLAIAALDAGLPERDGVTLAGIQPMAKLPGGREHFGFRDGFAQPAIVDDEKPIGPWAGHGTPVPRRRGRAPAWEPLLPGEILHGYPDEDGDDAPGPAAPFDRGGTYMVVRKLRQHVGAWRAMLHAHGGGDAAREELIAAQIVGRWSDGTPLALSPDSADAAISGDRERRNAFGYADDPRGLRCPTGAHVRRANPRDAFGDGRLVRRHRIVRRGMPYGPPGDDDSVDRGLVFVCFQASIERQFELIQRHWCNDGDAFGLDRARDLLLSDGDDDARLMLRDRPRAVARTEHPLVVTRDGGYFYVPALSGLRALCEGE